MNINKISKFHISSMAETARKIKICNYRMCTKVINTNVSNKKSKTSVILHCTNSLNFLYSNLYINIIILTCLICFSVLKRYLLSNVHLFKIHVLFSFCHWGILFVLFLVYTSQQKKKPLTLKCL